MGIGLSLLSRLASWSPRLDRTELPTQGGWLSEPTTHQANMSLQPRRVCLVSLPKISISSPRTRELLVYLAGALVCSLSPSPPLSSPPPPAHQPSQANESDADSGLGCVFV